MGVGCQGCGGVPTPEMPGCGTQGLVGIAQGLDPMLLEIFSSLNDPEEKPTKISSKSP